MGSIWTLANIEEIDFAAAATLLAIRAKQQSLLTTEQPDIEFSDESDFEDDGEEDCGTCSPMSRLSNLSRNALINKFLDRLGEVFSREKSFIQHGNWQGSKHVASTAWIRRSTTSSLTIVVAKNEGLDDRDRKMLSQLQLWFRAISATGRHSPIMADIVWIKDTGLVEYSRNRLWYHISQINQLDRSMDEVATRSGIYCSVVTCLQGLCQKATLESTVRQLSDIVNIAYILRYVCKNLQKKEEYLKPLRSINMLGRLRAAYECFKTTALTFEDISTTVIQPVNLHQPMRINGNHFRKHLQRLVKEFQLPKGLLKNKTTQRYTAPSQLYIHAEMQILVSLAMNAQWHGRAHWYIGTSRKPCFLCDQILQKYTKMSIGGVRKPAFKARQSHGKVYPLWTLPRDTVEPLVASIAIATATTSAYHQVQQYLQHEPASQAAVAESSARVTEPASVSPRTSAIKKQYLAEQRIWCSSKMAEGSEEPVTLGRKLKSVFVAILPADGSTPKLVPINFHALPEKHDSRIRETGFASVPDFHQYWGECQFDRRYQVIVVENQINTELEGSYRLYWNENHELTENEYIKSFLDIKEVNTFRRFWYGDAFAVRFSEHPKTFAYDVHDAPAAILQFRQLDTVFKEMWESQSLEKKLESDRYLGNVQEKLDADKEIILQRMTPIEQDIMSRLPPSTLQYLALTACDDGAMGNVNITKDPNDPTMTKVETMTRITALDSIGWTGFHSSQL